jgi:hypothetical protein
MWGNVMSVLGHHGGLLLGFERCPSSVLVIASNNKTKYVSITSYNLRMKAEYVFEMYMLIIGLAMGNTLCNNGIILQNFRSSLRYSRQWAYAF